MPETTVEATRARLPGEGRGARRAMVAERGIEITEDRLANLKAMAEAG